MELNGPPLHGVHGSDNAHLAFGDHCVKHLASVSNLLDYTLYVLLGNPLNEFIAWQFTALLRELDRGSDLTEQACKSAQFHAVTRSLHCTTAGVSQDHNQS